MKIIQSQPIVRMRVPYEWWRQPFFYISESIYWQSFTFICIIINTIVLALEWHGQSVSISQSLDNVNFVFSAIFIVEIMIKFTGYGLRFLQDHWNIFDLVIVSVTVIGIIMSSS
jgi:voltage-dependent calcium channel L type alpha-1D